jgi:hypothetical protein
MEPRYYKFNTLRLTLRQYWLFFLVCKLLRIRIPVGYWPNPALLEPLGASAGDSPLAPRVTAMVRDLEAEGFDSVLYYHNPTVNRTETCAAALVSEDRLTLAPCVATRAMAGGKISSAEAIGCVSRRTDGRELTTVNRRPLMPTGPHTDPMRPPGATVREVAAAHRARLAGLRLHPFNPTEVSLLEEVRASARKQVAFLVERGILVPMTELEVEMARREARG